jgi:hypothetical protein
MTVSEVGRIAIFFSRGEFPLEEESQKAGIKTIYFGDRYPYAWVTQATSAAKPSMWSFSRCSTSGVISKAVTDQG